MQSVQSLQIDGTTLASVVGGLLGPDVEVAVTDPRTAHQPLFPEEQSAMARARPDRRREFSAGRQAARHAMKLLGHPEVAIPMARDRRPVWPRRLVGSISHNEDTCIAVITESLRTRSIAIDIEQNLPLDEDLVPEICTIEERAWLASQPERHRLTLAKLLFSAKECTHKCHYPVSKKMLGFHDITITPDLDTGQFEATFIKGTKDFERGSILPGRFVIHDQTIITTMLLSRV